MSPVVQDRPRGRLMFGALLGSFAVVAALVASASAGAGESGPTIDYSRQLSAERNATLAGDIELDAHGPTFSLEVCINGVPHRWEGEHVPGRTFGSDLDDLDDLDADPDGECNMPGFGPGRGGHGGMFDFAPNFEAFEACLAEQGADADSPADGNRTSVIVVGPDGRTVVEFSDDPGSVTVTGTGEGVEVTAEGGAAVVDIEARERSRREAFVACESLLPEPPKGKFNLFRPFEGGGHDLDKGFFGERLEEFELELELHEVDPGEHRRERRAAEMRELFSGVADDGGRCGGASQSA